MKSERVKVYDISNTFLAMLDNFHGNKNVHKVDALTVVIIKSQVIVENIIKNYFVFNNEIS